MERISAAEWAELQRREPYLRWGVAVGESAANPAGARLPDAWRTSEVEEGARLVAISRRRKSTGASSVHVVRVRPAGTQDGPNGQNHSLDAELARGQLDAELARGQLDAELAGEQLDAELAGGELAGGELVALVAELIPLLGVTGLTVPRAFAVPVARLLPVALPGFDLGASVGHDRPDPHGIGWDWMWSARRPSEALRARAASSIEAARVVAVRLDVTDPAVRTALETLLDAESPRHSANPGDPQVQQWFGLVTDPEPSYVGVAERAGAAGVTGAAGAAGAAGVAGVAGVAGALVACAAWYEAVPGVPLLASVAVESGYRGRGLGVALTVTVIEAAFAAGCDVITVDLYADNPVARNLYENLGFTLEQEFASWWLAPRQGSGS